MLFITYQHWGFIGFYEKDIFDICIVACISTMFFCLQ